MDSETPEADAAEQARHAEDPVTEDVTSDTDPVDEADPADLADQRTDVPVDEDYDRE
ncbi:hypothetical protein GCM10027271_33320 [Saccharopolyspora gloriosae]|uniref:Uncharacterized protein n=1 Tax=Saccharopolyspora gloriosae TaxID=455344 RepID=A0A840NHV1_9PSEU|nr:hypothetical protein [Saccharopolyspora gloriosae]MBB5069773.1 hypothetical protein [Saccharopolyspora gloriosae]